MTDIVDYALPLIRIERLAKDIHELCVDQQYAAAQEYALQLGAEARLLHHTLELMKEKNFGQYKKEPAITQTTEGGQQVLLSGDRRDHAPQGRNGSRVLRGRQN